MTAVEERRLKGILKIAVAEVLVERQDLLRDALREGLEDMATIRAIQSGEKSPLISRKKVFRRFQSAA
jgi:predicted transcriptional regulator